MPGYRLLPTFFICAIALTGLVSRSIGTKSETLQETDSKKPDTAATSCLFDVERGEIPGCLNRTAEGKLLVTQQVLKELHFDSYGLAAIRSAREGWMYVSHGGRVLISGVPTMDNWADSFHDGLVRVVRNNKYGFANRKGQVVISAIYDGAMNFEKGKAKVCNRCVSKCVDHNCEYHVFAGGEWFEIDTKGTVVARIRPDN